jgi:hypothetical protein
MEEKFILKLLLVITCFLLVVSTYNAIKLYGIPPQAKIYSDLASTSVKVEESHKLVLSLDDDVREIKNSLEEVRAMTVLRYRKIEELGGAISESRTKK